VADVITHAEIFPAERVADDGRIFMRLIDADGERHQDQAESAGLQNTIELPHRLAVIGDVFEHVRADEDVGRLVRIADVGEVNAVLDIVAI
jgi:hypothetical protein